MKQQQHNFSPVQTRMYSIASVWTQTTRQTPWERGCPRVPSPPWTSISNCKDSEQALSWCVSCCIAAQVPSTGPQSNSASQRCHNEFQIVLAVWRNQHTGNFLASKDELRASCNILLWYLQCTDRYSISWSSLRAPCTSMNLSLVMSTRVQTDSFLSVPLIRRYLFVFLKWAFSWVSNLYYVHFMERNSALYLSPPPSAASIHVLHCSQLTNSARPVLHSLE